MDSIVSFNIIRKVIKPDNTVMDKLLNRKNIPIIFHSTTDLSILEELDNNESLHSVLDELGTFTYINYANTTIEGIKYCLSNKSFEENILRVQDLFVLDNLENGDEIATELIEYYIAKLYENCGGKISELGDNPTQNIIDVCKIIKKNFSSEYNREQMISFIKKSLETVSQLNPQNLEYCVNKFKNILESQD